MHLSPPRMGIPALGRTYLTSDSCPFAMAVSQTLVLSAFRWDPVLITEGDSRQLAVLSFCFVETESHHVAQASLVLEIPLPQLPGNFKCLDGKYIPPGLTECIG